MREPERCLDRQSALGQLWVLPSVDRFEERKEDNHGNHLP